VAGSGAPVADVLIVGGGLAGARTARALRDLGFAGAIRLVSEEKEPPYDRPPLSKDFLLGLAGDDAIRLMSEQEAAALEVELHLGHRAVGLQPRRRRVRLADGGVLPYGTLVIATGARARRMPALNCFSGVHYLRTAADARRLRSALAGRPRLAIVGGGFIGLEVAAAARTLGCEVTVVEAAEAPLATVIGPDLGRAVQAWHEDRGVRFRCGAAVRAARGDGRIASLELADGTSVPAREVVAGVGIEPNVEWLAPAGVELHRGVVCDADGRTAAEGVFAAGDAACRHVDDRCLPGGHWTATNEQALRVAAAIAGRPETRPPGDPTYFWSDQFDSRLQFAGRAGPGTEVSVVSGAVGARSFLAHCHRGGRVTGVFAMNDPGAFVRARIALSAGRAAGAAAPSPDRTPTRSR
jgi:3-phenylpropionate/trans-cinnamate dioxygenase ferredoxin reductase component